MGGHILGIIFSFACAWMLAGLFVTNRLLKGVDNYTVMFYHGISGFLISFIYLCVDAHNHGNFFFFVKYSPTQFFYCLLGCLSDCICVYSGLMAAQSGTLGFISLITYTQIVYAFLSDLFIFHENFNLIDLLAAGVIILTTIGVSIYKLKLKANATNSQQKN